MADQIFMRRALDENADPVSGALAYFYTTGTTTPLTVYANTSLTVAHPTPLEADAAGAFPQVFVSTGTTVRLNVTDGDGVSIPGYPVDPAPVMSIASSAAGSVTFSPITGNASTNVQDAIEVNTNRHEDRSADVKDLLGAASDSEFRSKLGLGTFSTEDTSDFVQTQPNWNAGTDTTERTISPAKLQTKVELMAIGWGQTWQNVSGSRAAGTAYQNNTGKPIMVSIDTSTDAGAIQVSSDSSTWVDIATTGYYSANFIVPNGWYYRLSGSPTISIWSELR